MCDNVVEEKERGEMYECINPSGPSFSLKDCLRHDLINVPILLGKKMFKYLFPYLPTHGSSLYHWFIKCLLNCFIKMLNLDF